MRRCLPNPRCLHYLHPAKLGRGDPSGEDLTGGQMDDLAGKIIAGAAGGLLSSTITASVAYIVGRKQRRQAFKLAEKQSLEKFIDDAAEYAADAEKLVDLTQEIHGQEEITAKDIDNLFVLHTVDATPRTSSLLQRAVVAISASSLEQQRRSAESRRQLWLCYKEAKLRDDLSDIGTLRGLVGDVYRHTALAFDTIQAEINQLTRRLASFRSE
jgi:hypothetical protein